MTTSRDFRAVELIFVYPRPRLSLEFHVNTVAVSRCSHLSHVVLKMKSFVLASLLASAAAFAPATQQRASTSLNEFCNGYVGGDSVEPMFIGETGSKNFDPAGFTTVGTIHSQL